MRVSIIAALDKKRGIGKDNKLLWHIPEDLKRFKDLTSGHTIIMGRKTFESIGRVLPNRNNVIITRDQNYKAEGAVVVHSLEEALNIAKETGETQGAKETNGEIFIIGGGQIFSQALPIVDKLYLTIVDARLDSPPDSPARRGEFDADTFFPDYSEFKKIVFEQEGQSEKYKYKFLDLEK
ncbi:MAG: dihydrofolate reductase [Candidatus Levybacteria bacterium]|nr:dihydrofolate reductase [Candidatus Levybacteria bacterium]